MSICRWSSDNYRSDVYVYSHGGWTIHVASYRIAFHPDHPLLPIPLDGDPAAWVAYTEASRVAHEHTERSRIDHPLAGASYREPTAAACLRRLQELSAEGFHVPEFAFDSLVDEVTDETQPHEL